MNFRQNNLWKCTNNLIHIGKSFEKLQGLRYLSLKLQYNMLGKNYKNLYYLGQGLR